MKNNRLNSILIFGSVLIFISIIICSLEMDYSGINLIFGVPGAIAFSAAVAGYVGAYFWKPGKKALRRIGATVAFLIYPLVLFFTFAPKFPFFHFPGEHYNFDYQVHETTIYYGIALFFTILSVPAFGALASLWASKTKAKEIREETIRTMKEHEENRNYAGAFESLELIKNIDKSLDTENEYPEELVLLGDSYYMQTEFPKALEYYEKALKIEPTNRMATDAKEKALNAMNAEKQEMAEGLEMAMNYEEAAKIYEQIGMWNDARRCREKLTAPPPAPDTEKHPGLSHPTMNRQHVQNIYSSNRPDTKKQHTFDFGDFFSYTIQRKIGSGGFSDVYLVERNGKRYAMKIPKGVDLKGDDTIQLPEGEIDKYAGEAEIWATLTEKEPASVVNLLDAGLRPFPWFVMELGERKLDEAVRSAPTHEKLRILGDLLGKLDRIHHYGVVHKDIKPDNILYLGGNWKFTDFGLSKVLSKSSKSSAGFSGTMLYMAPEQVSKKHFGNTDWRTDIWQMGVLAYEMLTGHLPFESEDAFEATSAILHEEPVPATRYGVDERVWQAIRKALEKRKKERWQSALEFKNALEGV